MHVFATLRLLRGLLEPILAPLRLIQSRKGTPKLVQKCSKKCPKTGPKNDPKNNQKIANFGPQNGPQNGPRWRGHSTGIFSRCLLKITYFQDVPKMAQDGLKQPKIAPSGSKKGPKMTPKWLKTASNSPGQPQNRPKIASNSLRQTHFCSKIGPSWPKHGPKEPQEVSLRRPYKAL